MPRWLEMNEVMGIVKQCENQLGWQPPRTKSGRLYYSGQVRVIEWLMKHDPMVTVDNLKLAIAYSRRKRLSVKQPAFLVYRIEDALALTNIERKPTKTEEIVDNAIAWENRHPDPKSDYWIGRLMRANGEGRLVAVSEWLEAGRGRG
jgi:hypothetical protein